MNTDPDLYSRLGRVEGKMDLMLDGQNLTNTKLDRLDGRVDKLEHARSRNRGKQAAYMGMAGIMGAVLAKVKALGGG